jgi:hypothetical protein
MFRSMSEHDPYVPPVDRPQRFRFTFKRRFRRAKVYDNVIASGVVGDARFYMLTQDGGVTTGVPMRRCRITIEPV